MRGRTRARAVFLLWASLGASGGLAARTRHLQLAWPELPPVISGRNVKLVLADGVRVEGKVRSVEPESLQIDTRKTSDRKSHPKGPGGISRASVSVIRLVEHRGPWRLILALAIPAGLGATVAASAPKDAEGGVVIIAPAVGAAAALGGAVAGYYLGKRADRQVTEITLTPR